MAKEFFKAEQYHQNYYNLNKNTNMYCQVVAGKKIGKFIKAINNNKLGDLLV